MSKEGESMSAKADLNQVAKASKELLEGG